MSENLDEDGIWSEDEEWIDDYEEIGETQELSKPLKTRELTKVEEDIIEVLALEEAIRKKYPSYPYQEIPDTKDYKQLLRYLMFRIYNWIERQEGKIIKPKYQVREPYRQTLGQLLLQDFITDVTGEEDPARGVENFIPCYMSFLCKSKEWVMDYGLRVLESKYPEEELIQYAKQQYQFLPNDTIKGLVKMELSKEQLTKDNTSKNKMVAVMNQLAESIIREKQEQRRLDEERRKPREVKAKESQELTTDAVQDLIKRLKSQSQISK